MERQKIERAMRVIENEIECVKRDCDRDCGKCELVLDADWILSAYNDVLEVLKAQ